MPFEWGGKTLSIHASAFATLGPLVGNMMPSVASRAWKGCNSVDQTFPTTYHSLGVPALSGATIGKHLGGEVTKWHR